MRCAPPDVVIKVTSGSNGENRARTVQVHKMASQAIDELIVALDAGKSQQLTEYLAMLGKFHRYSVMNQMLIMAQNPQATRVAGYGTWKRMGRQVKRGSKGIRILAPIMRKQAVDEAANNDDNDDEETVLGFRTAHVFDISQTDGKDLPEFTRVSGEPGVFTEKLKRFVAGQGIRLLYSNRLGSADGQSMGELILLRNGMAPAEEFSVLVHELAHSLLHRHDTRLGRDGRTARETEAEAVAFAVSQAVGLESRSASADYIQLYQGSRNTLMASLERIQRTASEIINAVLPEDRRMAG